MDYGCANELPADDKRHEEFAKQRQERDFDETTLWSLDGAIIKFIHPRLIAFREVMIPKDKTDIDKVILACELYKKAGYIWPLNREDSNKVQEGIDTFAKIFGGLWT